MKAIIEKVENGYIIEVPDPDSERYIRVVFEEEEGEYDMSSGSNNIEQVDNFVKVLQFFAYSFGPSTSRYSAKRISINTKPGDKFEDYKE